MGLARERLSGNEFIFDVHTHPPELTLVRPWMAMRPDRIALDYIRLVFVQTDTTMTVMTGWPDARNQNEANVRANDMLGEIMARLGGDRYRFHANAEPDLAGEPDYIERLASQFKNIAAWKVYPAGNANARLHQRPDFLERVRKTPIKLVAAHRGLAGNGGFSHPGSPDDVVRAALMFPDIKFLMYHSGFESAGDENHPYVDMGEQTRGVDRFVKAMLWAQEQNGGKPLDNVYADLGTTWSRVMGNQSTASHLVGKLLKYVGPDKVLFGTDALNVGTPHASQLAAMRTFDILPGAEGGRDLLPVHHPGAAAQDLRAQCRGRVRRRSAGGSLPGQQRRHQQAADGLSGGSALGPDAPSAPLPGPAHPAGVLRPEGGGAATVRKGLVNSGGAGSRNSCARRFPRL